MDLPTNQPIPFYVNAGRLWRSQQQRFFILWTPSMENPQPSLFLIGSIGNKYKVYLSLDYISCSCNDYFSCTSSTQKLCKHILLLLQIIAHMVTSGTLLLHPHTKYALFPNIISPKMVFATHRCNPLHVDHTTQQDVKITIIFFLVMLLFVRTVYLLFTITTNQTKHALLMAVPTVCIANFKNWVWHNIAHGQPI